MGEKGNGGLLIIISTTNSTTIRHWFVGLVLLVIAIDKSALMLSVHICRCVQKGLVKDINKWTHGIMQKGRPEAGFDY